MEPTREASTPRQACCRGCREGRLYWGRRSSGRELAIWDQRKGERPEHEQFHCICGWQNDAAQRAASNLGDWVTLCGAAERKQALPSSSHQKQSQQGLVSVPHCSSQAQGWGAQGSDQGLVLWNTTPRSRVYTQGLCPHPGCQNTCK